MLTNDRVLIPPFKTQGIKSKLVSLIRSTVAVDNNTKWIEPFMGSAVVGLNVAKSNAVFADINPHIVNFYNQLKSGVITARIVKAFLEEQGALLSEKNDEYYYIVRERFNKEHNPLDFLFLNRSCFNGMIRFNKRNEYNVPYGHKPERFAKAYITKIVNQVKNFQEKLIVNNWTFLCQSFEDTIALADDDSFIYCDPPYIGRHVDYYDSWDEKQERRLKDCLLASGSRFMLSTWDCNQYRANPYVFSIWGSCSKVTQKHFYFVGAKEENRNAMTEALLINFPIKNADNHEQQIFSQLSLDLISTH